MGHSKLLNLATEYFSLWDQPIMCVCVFSRDQVGGAVIGQMYLIS